MTVRRMLGAVSILAAVGAAGSTHAQSAAEAAVAGNPFAQEVVAGLQADGYRVVELRKSFLGRLRIVVENGVHQREIVVTSTTGEIMRDILVGGNGNGNGNGRALGRSDDRPGNASSAGSNGNGGGNGGGNGNGNGGGNGNGK